MHAFCVQSLKIRARVSRMHVRVILQMCVCMPVYVYMYAHVYLYAYAYGQLRGGLSNYVYECLRMHMRQ